MFQRILVVDTALVGAPPLFTAAGHLAQATRAHLLGLTLGSGDHMAHWADWASYPVEQVPEMADTAEAILAATELYHVDLIVMTSEGRAVGDFVTPSTLAEAVMHTTTLPMLLLREGHLLRVPTAANPFRTLIPLDGSAAAEGILHAATAMTVALAKPMGGIIHLVRVMRTLTEAGYSQRETTLSPAEQGHQYLVDIAHQLRAVAPAYVTVTTQVAPASDVVEALLALLGVIPRNDGAPTTAWDLIAMGMREITNHEPHEGHSVADRMLQATHLPFLIQGDQTTRDRLSPGVTVSNPFAR